jgi:hypothetical protein
MLIAESTRYYAGIGLFGDFLDLRNLRETIHYLVEGDPIGGGESPLGEFVLGLAYDVRHAYQKDRETREIISYRNDTATYAGFRYLWPFLLPQVGLLRWSASYHPTSRHHQAVLTKLEGCIEDVLCSIDPAIGKEVFDMLIHFAGLSGDYYVQSIEHCALLYVTEAKPGKARFRLLPKILHMMLPGSNEYEEFASHLEADAMENGCSPHELTDFAEWPDFKW